LCGKPHLVLFEPSAQCFVILRYLGPFCHDEHGISDDECPASAE